MICPACTEGDHAGCEGDVRLVAFMQNRPDPERYCRCYKWDYAHLQGKQNGFTAEELGDHEHNLGIGVQETRYDDREDQWERELEETSVPYEIGG